MAIVLRDRSGGGGGGDGEVDERRGPAGEETEEEEERVATPMTRKIPLYHCHKSCLQKRINLT